MPGWSPSARAQLVRLAVAGLGLVEEAAMALDVADVDQRRRDGAPVAEPPPRLERRRRAVERLVVARQEPQHLADVVERAGDAARVAGLLEQLEPALEILERHRQVALLAIDAPHLVERDRRLGARGDDPRQAQHALERPSAESNSPFSWKTEPRSCHRWMREARSPWPRQSSAAS